jgi:RNA polymerase sigma-70 factor (ECF subfamily)
VRNYDVATDIAQDVFLKVYEKGEVLGKETELRLLYTVARNKVIDFFRKKKTASLDANQELFHTIADMSILRPDEQVMQTSDTETLFTLLDQLSDTDREIIIMRYLQELEYSEIAKIVGKEESNVRQIVSRGIKKLKELYENNYEQE